MISRSLVALLSALPLLTFSSPVPTSPPSQSSWASVATGTPDQPQYDVLIIGGGPAGLSALSGLARVRRRAHMIDSGEYRNGLTRHAHDIIGSDGVSPAYLRAKAREQISLYPTVSMQNGTVVNIDHVANGSSGAAPYFVVTDTTGVQYTSQKVVLGTGLKDLVPSTPGLPEYWSKGIYWCPWCDGYEHRDQPLGLIGPINDIPGLVEEIETLNTDLIAFVNGSLVPDNVAALEEKHPDWQSMLTAYHVQIENRTIARIERLQDGSVVHSDSDKAEYDKFLVHLDDGTTIERAAFFTSFPSQQRSDVGEKLGVTIVDKNRLFANFTQGMRTNVPGVYAVGDANSDGSTNVPHAMWSGKRAAVDIHLQMAKDDAQSAIALAGLKRDLGDDASEEDILMDYMGRDLERVWM